MTIFLHKIKEVVTAVFPVICLVLVLHLFVEPLPAPLFRGFLVAIVLLIIGMALFLQGVDIGLQKFGHDLGSLLARRRNLAFFLAVGFLVGFLVTAAEPDLQILASQVHTINPELSHLLLVFAVAVGSGLFVLLGLLHHSLRLSLKVCLLGSYLLIFALAAFASPYFRPLAFDSGGVTTGPMTVPFILALGLGLASVQSSQGGEEEGFGLVALMSAGPIVAVMLLSLFSDSDLSGASLPQADASAALGSLRSRLFPLLGHATKETLIAFSPLCALFVLFQLLYFRLPLRRFLRVCMGFLFSGAGLILFLTGANLGFLPVGQHLGGFLAGTHANWLLPIGALLGVAIVLAEPSVWILTDQIEEVTSGSIPKSHMLSVLAGGVGLAIFLAMVRLRFEVPFLYILVPGYALALILMRFTKPLFTAIAFDSGGVASGVMASTFILPFTLGAADRLGRNPLTEAFGVVALVALAPLLVIQIMGILAARRPSAESLLWQDVSRLAVELRDEEQRLFREHKRGEHLCADPGAGIHFDQLTKRREAVHE